MNTINNYVLTRKESVIASSVCLLFSLVSLILYIVFGTTATSFIGKYTTSLFVGFGLAIALGVAGLILNREEVLFLQYFASLYCCLRFLASLAELFGGLVYGEESAKMPASFVCIIAMTLIASIVSIIFGILLMKKRNAKKNVEVKDHE